MCKRQTGIILISALIFTSLLALVAVASLDIAIIETKISKNHLQQQIAFEAAEAGIKQAAQEIISKNQAYPYVQDSLNELKSSWWQQQTAGNYPEAKAFYVIEQWPAATCIQVDNKTKTVHYYRIGSYAVAQAGSTPTILQANFAKSLTESCRPEIAMMPILGQLSWQQIK